MSFSVDQLGVIDLVRECAKTSGSSVYLVGGIVRDLFLGQKLHDKDLDFLVDGELHPLVKQVSHQSGGELREFKKFFTAKIEQPNIFRTLTEIDFALARTEIYPSPGALPQVERGTLAVDLSRRDFSINAIALPIAPLSRSVLEQPDISYLASLCLDPYDGRSALEQRKIRILHERSFIDDPTRLFRACRYQARIRGVLDPNTAELFQEALHADSLTTISHFRVFREIEKILVEPLAIDILGEIQRSGLVKYVELFLNCEIDQLVEELLRSGEFQKLGGRERVDLALGCLVKRSTSSDQVFAFLRRANVGKKRLARLTEIATTISDNRL